MDDILAQLNPQQQEAVVYNQGPLLILAGAGSGKTRVLTIKTAYLIQKEKFSPSSLLLVTFTNKAAQEMKQRIAKLLPDSPHLPWAGTFHSFAAQVLRRSGHHLGLSEKFIIFDEQDQLETIKMALVHLDLSPQKIKPTSILATISQAKNELISPQEYFQYARGPFQKTVSQIYPLYQKLLNRYQALDFDDLLLFAVKLFQKEPTVLSHYQSQFRYLLVDEYQDTNTAQYQLTKLLVNKNHAFCAVGDASQSIYSWRGANYRNLSYLQNDFPDLKILNLEQNYRSTQIILNSANAVIAKNTSHPILRLWTENKKGERITIFEASNELQEAKFIIETIFSLESQNPNLSNFAILYRTNAQSRLFEEALLKAGIPYLLVGGLRFYERKEIKDCLAYLRLVANPNDLVSYQRAQKIGLKKLEKFFQFLENNPVAKFATGELLDQILSITSYLELYQSKDEEDLARLENIKELHSVASEFPDLYEFLENVSLVQKENLPSRKNRLFWEKNLKPQVVTLSTIHAAKGTEFNTVFLVGMEEGLFPHSRSLFEKEELEEERRLCYVGMTRAKERLYLTLCRRRLYFGQRTQNLPSRFLEDIPPHLVQLSSSDSDTI